MSPPTISANLLRLPEFVISTDKIFSIYHTDRVDEMVIRIRDEVETAAKINGSVYRVVGFDTECNWKGVYKDRVALIQIATLESVYLFHIKSILNQNRLPDSLALLLKDFDIKKVITLSSF